MRESIVDFNHVPANQADINDRLINWARWCHSGSGRGGVLPMFRGYRPYIYPERDVSIPIDSKDAVEVQKTMAHLPERHRLAVQWCYVVRNNPMRMCNHLVVSRSGLMALITDGRTMVKNRLTRVEHCA